ncbi:hypothetical protein SAMN03159463_05878 [Mesorhizobium sp. NFR06]|uniref:hypothetical protein n=1 Tax=Mesorhizobium sp. NFR06 TaxID=1566290 RepID=UPI0008F3D201|nr:hypothetical protein [Mesorhizobium sp. NFR06]SFQ17803.1 hypothetical protein SAMN03159463_05878 [Mesorhizobium sp. NFR06]
MQDHELIERPGRGWTPWKEGTGGSDIDKVWWAARCLHFAKLNVSCWFDGSDLVGIEHWGYRRQQWCMKRPPADHPPMPEVYRLERERERQEALDRIRIAAQTRPLAAIERTGKRQSAPDVSAVWNSGRQERAL